MSSVHLCPLFLSSPPPNLSSYNTNSITASRPPQFTQSQAGSRGVCVLIARLCPTLCVSCLAALQAPPSMGFSRHEYWSGLPFPSPRDPPNSGMESGSPALQADSLPSESPGKPGGLAEPQRILEWVAMPSSRGSCQPRGWTLVSGMIWGDTHQYSIGGGHNSLRLTWNLRNTQETRISRVAWEENGSYKSQTLKHLKLKLSVQNWERSPLCLWERGFWRNKCAS